VQGCDYCEGMSLIWVVAHDLDESLDLSAINLQSINEWRTKVYLQSIYHHFVGMIIMQEQFIVFDGWVRECTSESWYFDMS
jgi:hypothetical protein